MSDPGTIAADKAQAEMERRMRKIYGQAYTDIIDKLNAFTKRMNSLEKVKRAQMLAGEITEDEFNKWMAGQLFRQKQWKNKVDDITAVLFNANKEANEIVEGKKRAVFGENASYQAYEFEKHTSADMSFNVYDSATVTRLLRDQPELLPRKVVNGVKDRAWNRTKIANAVTTGIIEGESIPDIAKRIARETTSENMKAMVRYARTAMTGAQNAGRMEAMHDAQSMGIKVKKKWLATLDKRTRDAHQELDGQVRDVDEPFDSALGKIMYPGDPAAQPGNIWNCRCTLIYEYPDYPNSGVRRDGNKDLVGDMDYSEWKTYKTGETGKFEALYDAYESKAKPGEPNVQIDEGYVSNDKEHETEIAKMLSAKYGGLVRMVNQTGTVSMPDYIWNGKKWELKGAKSLNAAYKRTQDAIHQAETWGGNIIIDFTGDDIYGALKQIRTRLRRSARQEHDVIVLHRGRVFQIFKYNK